MLISYSSVILVCLLSLYDYLCSYVLFVDLRVRRLPEVQHLAREVDAEAEVALEGGVREPDA